MKKKIFVQENSVFWTALLFLNYRTDREIITRLKDSRIREIGGISRAAGRVNTTSAEDFAPSATSGPARDTNLRSPHEVRGFHTGSVTGFSRWVTRGRFLR